MKYVFLVLLLFCNVACAAPQESCGFRLNPQGKRISWKNVVPDITIDPSLPFKFHQPIQNAINSFNKAADRTLLNYKGVDSVHNIKLVTNWIKNSKYTALTSTFSFHSNIVIAFIEINNNQTFSDTYNINDIDIESLMLHEFGHFLGLEHNNDEPSVMNHILNPGVIRRTLYDIDIKNLKCEY